MISNCTYIIKCSVCKTNLNPNNIPNEKKSIIRPIKYAIKQAKYQFEYRNKSKIFPATEIQKTSMEKHYINYIEENEQQYAEQQYAKQKEEAQEIQKKKYDLIYNQLISDSLNL